MSLSPDTHTHATDNSPVSSISDCAQLSTSQGCDAKYNRDDSEDGGKQPDSVFELPWDLFSFNSLEAAALRVGGVRFKDLYSKSRKSNLVALRSSLMIAAHLGGMSYTDIGKTMGRDHTTVMHHCDLMRSLLNKDLIPPHGRKTRTFLSLCDELFGTQYATGETSDASESIRAVNPFSELTKPEFEAARILCVSFPAPLTLVSFKQRMIKAGHLKDSISNLPFLRLIGTLRDLGDGKMVNLALVQEDNEKIGLTKIGRDTFLEAL